MDLEYCGQVALVTGGSRGIGRAVAEVLAAEGAALALCARDEGPLREAAEALRRAGAPAVLALRADARHEAEAAAAVERVAAELGRLDLLVNAAGGDGVVRPLLELDLADWLRDLEENLLGAVSFCRAAVPVMRNGGGGRIVTIASTAALEPGALYAPYSAAKAALVAYTRCLADAFSGEGILANVVVPGPVDTAQMARVEEAVGARLGVSPAAAREAFAAAIPLGRYLEPREVADLIAFLGSPRASGISGGVFRVDGGLVRPRT